MGDNLEERASQAADASSRPERQLSLPTLRLHGTQGRTNPNLLISAES
jgi:hypothetical protein